MRAECMVRDMFRARLRKADIDAVCGNRGFDPRHAATPELLEHVFLSPAGVERAMATLGEREVILLHVLDLVGEEVGIGAFEDLYGRDPDDASEWIPESQRHKRAFREVQDKLLQKGVLVVAETEDLLYSRAPALSRLRFLFPREFAPFLPRPCKASRVDGGATWERRPDAGRASIEGVLHAAGGRKDDGRTWHLRAQDGDLFLGPRPFSAALLRDVQIRQWNATWGSKGREALDPSLTPARAVLHALGTLADDEAAAPEALEPFLRVALRQERLRGLAAFCCEGVNRGFLERTLAGGSALYRPLRAPGPEPDPGDYLDGTTGDVARIDVAKVPPRALETIAAVCAIEVESRALLARPCLRKVGRAPEAALRDPVAAWLSDRLPPFRETVALVERRRGRTFVHENLAVARVRDLGLKVEIERQLGSACRSLSEECLAFPRSLHGRVAALVRKAGHVVKYAPRPEVRDGEA